MRAAFLLAAALMCATVALTATPGASACGIKNVPDITDCVYDELRPISEFTTQQQKIINCIVRGGPDC